MATATQLIALARAFERNDRSAMLHFFAQIAEGKGRGAEALREVLKTVPTVAPPPRGTEEFLRPADTSRRRRIQFQDAAGSVLRECVRQYQAIDRLAEFGFEAPRRLLFWGPPGTGKSLAARYLARTLNLPLFLAENVPSRFMGEASARLFKVFETARSCPGVYLFDEFDELAMPRRASPGDGSAMEGHRIVASLLKNFESPIGRSLIVCTTNLPELDHALARRFDKCVEFTLPSDEEIYWMIENCLMREDEGPNVCLPGTLLWDDILPAARGLSHANIYAACESVARATILRGEVMLDMKELIGELRLQRRTQETFATTPERSAGSPAAQ